MPQFCRYRSIALPLALLHATSPAAAETLNEALAKTYNSNPTLMAARAGQRAIDEGVSLVKADGRPELGIASEYGVEVHRQRAIITGVTGTKDFRTPERSISGQASLNVPIYQGGTVRNGIRSAKEQVKAGQNDLRATESSIFSAVVAAYLDVIRDSAIVALNRQNVAALEVNLQASSDRFEAGDLTRTDVAQSDSRLALARADLQSAEARLIGSKEQYIALVGSAPTDLEEPPSLPGLPESPDQAVQVALQNNPDILAAKHQRISARHDVNAAEGTIMPRISAFARGNAIDYLNSERDLTLPVEGSTKSATIGVQLNLPLYQGGRPGALQRQNIARESIAIEQQVAVERSVIAQTRSAYASWQASLQAITSTRKAVDSSSLSLEGVTAENSVGTRTILDILDAQRENLNARVQYVTAQRNAYVAGFSLLAAMGHAEARDLNLDGGPLYDPQANYSRVKNKLLDMEFDPNPGAQSSRTLDIPAQDAQTPPDPLYTTE